MFAEELSKDRGFLYFHSGIVAIACSNVLQYYVGIIAGINSANDIKEVISRLISTYSHN